MIQIKRGEEPGSLLKYRKQPNACYEELGKEEAEDIRRQMWEEQKGLCAYCMRRIKTPRDVRIEHYLERHPREGEYNSQKTLDYKKMLAVCYGNSLQPGVKREDMTCDAHRGNIPLTVNPFEEQSIRKITYTADGRITSEDKEIRKDLEETLNLNCKASSLPENRKNVLFQTKQEIYRQCKNKNHEIYIKWMNALYQRYMVQRELKPYCGIVIEWLERELKIK